MFRKRLRRDKHARVNIKNSLIDTEESNIWRVLTALYLKRPEMWRTVHLNNRDKPLRHTLTRFGSSAESEFEILHGLLKAVQNRKTSILLFVSLLSTTFKN